MRKPAALLLLVTALGTVSLWADVQTVHPVDDRTIQSGGGLVVSSDVYLRTFGTTSCCENFWRSALEFDLSGVPAGSLVSSSVLYLRDQGTQIAGAVIQIHGYSGDGVITAADAAIDNLVASYTVPGGGADHYLDVTVFIQSLVNAGDPFAGFMLRSAVEGPTVFSGADIASNEYSTVAFRPTLVTTFGPAGTVAPVPEPGSLLLLACCVGAVGLLRRRPWNVRPWTTR